MGTTSGQRVGLAIVRVWLDGDHPFPLRARVTTIDDIAGPAADAAEWACGDRDEVLVHLGSWLDGWLEASR